MKEGWPHFKLTRVLENGAEKRVEVLPIHSINLETNLGRRSFFGVGSAITTVGALALSGCGQTTAESDYAEPPADPAAEDPAMAPATDYTTTDPAAAAPAYDPAYSEPAYTPPAADTYYPPPPPPPQQTTGADQIVEPCTYSPPPPGYVCTCNCVAE